MSYEMQSSDGVGSVLRHDDRFVVLEVPGGGLLYHVVGDHRQRAR